MKPAAFQQTLPANLAAAFPEPTSTAGSQNRQPSFAADLLTVLPFPTLLLTPAGQIRDANPTITTLLGMARDELRGHSIFDAVDPTNHPTCDQLLRTACIESGSTQIGELAFIAPSGATLLMRCSIL